MLRDTNSSVHVLNVLTVRTSTDYCTIVRTPTMSLVEMLHIASPTAIRQPLATWRPLWSLLLYSHSSQLSLRSRRKTKIKII